MFLPQPTTSTSTPAFGDDEWGQDEGSTTVLVVQPREEIGPSTFTQRSPPRSRKIKCLLTSTVFIGLGLAAILIFSLTGGVGSGQAGNGENVDDQTTSIPSTDRPMETTPVLVSSTPDPTTSSTPTDKMVTPSLQPMTCTTTECKEAVDRVKSSMDDSYEPCQDFYQYACGGWIRKQPARLREDKGINSATAFTTELRAMDKTNVKRIKKLIEGLPLWDPNMSPRSINTKIKHFYNSCINHKNLLQSLKKTDSSTSPKSRITNGIPGEIGKEEMKEWEEILKVLHFDPEYVKFALESKTRVQDDDTEAEAQSTLCAQLARELLPEGVAKLFVNSHFMDDNRTEEEINKLIETIRDTFQIQTSTSSPWLTDEMSRRNMSTSISGMIVISGYLSDMMNSTHVDDLYANVTISSDLLLNLRELIKARDDRNKRIDQIDLQYKFYTTTAQAQAFYSYILDAVFIPAGIVQTPAFHHSFPEVFKFSKLGSIVAHEFAHALHPYIEGITLGNQSLNTSLVFKESVVSSSSREEYGKRSQCVVDQYNQVQISLPSSDPLFVPLLRINGTLTVKENIADIIGIQIAFESFKEKARSSFQPIPGLSEKFSKEQIFFIANAQLWCQAYRDDETEVKLLKKQVDSDPHSPSSVRVLGSLRNYEEFSKAFKCPLGSRYNPAKKCAFFDR